MISNALMMLISNVLMMSISNALMMLISNVLMIDVVDIKCIVEVDIQIIDDRVSIQFIDSCRNLMQVFMQKIFNALMTVDIQLIDN